MESDTAHACYLECEVNSILTIIVLLPALSAHYLILHSIVHQRPMIHRCCPACKFCRVFLRLAKWPMAMRIPNPRPDENDKRQERLGS